MVKRYLTTSQTAELLGVTRATIFNWIKNKKLPALKIGKAYLIELKHLGLDDKEPSPKSKAEIKKAVKKVIQEYGEAIRKLGKE